MTTEEFKEIYPNVGMQTVLNIDLPQGSVLYEHYFLTDGKLFLLYVLPSCEKQPIIVDLNNMTYIKIAIGK